MPTKQRIAKCALETLEHYAAGDTVSGPVVCILCGDPNLNEKEADVICQRNSGPVTVDTCWHTEAGCHGRVGDVLWVKGAETVRFDITIGYSYEDRGMRNDSHDAFGIYVQMPLVNGTHHDGKSKRESRITGDAEVQTAKKNSGAPQPTAAGSREEGAGNEARSKYRLGMSLDRLRMRMEDEERKGKGKGKDRLNKEQKKLLELYDNGTLLSEANRLTKLSGHGTLKSPD